MFKKILVGDVEIRSLAAQSKGAHEIIDFLVKLNSNSAKTITEIFIEINQGKKRGRGIGRHSVMRTINSLKKYEPEKIKSKVVNGKTFFWISNTNPEPSINPKKILKTNSKELLAEITKEKILEKDLYPDVQEWLNNCPLDGVDFRYMITGGGFIDKSKYSNPDIIGTNIQGNLSLVVSVEVKNKIDNESELVGFAQCCSYKLFSDYVFLFCYKPNSSDRAGRLIKMCQFYGIGLKFLDDDKLIVPADRNDSKIGDSNQKHKIIEMLKL